MMHPKRVIFVRLPSGIFGNGGQTWIGIDLEPSRKMLESRGFEVIETSFDKLPSFDFLNEDIVVYSSCNDEEILGYLKDLFYFINKKCRVVPEYEFLLAHENKGFQEIRRRELGIGNLPGGYLYDLDSYEGDFPFVFKVISGAGSSGVHLVHGRRDLTKIKRKFFPVNLWRRIILIQRRIKLNVRQFEAYKYRHKGFFRYVAQTYIPDAKFDYKILVFGNRFFSLKRYVRDDDFRASGSGKFDFQAEIPIQVLDFARSVSDKLNAPQLSLDIIHSGQDCHLIEYQAVNFGPVTLTNSKGYHCRDQDGWRWVSEESELGECYAHSLEVFFDRNGVEAFK